MLQIHVRPCSPNPVIESIDGVYDSLSHDRRDNGTCASCFHSHILRLAPTSPDSYTYYARYLLSHSRAEEARLFLRSALELSPKDLTARELIAQTDAQTPPHSAGETPEPYLVLSLQDYREARYAESIAACRAALALRANYAEAWNNIGAAYNKLGRYDEAAACEEALRLKPDFELAQNNLQYAREMAKTSGK